ncbi:MAG TPA: cell division protein FtsL [Vicinamibacterales bacterium]|jgi:cell division protein FtsL|nr:cell division protein FtsL [Vicinamibacterales bacterium]
MEPFEYAIKKDVRNNPIVREVDAAREREQWKWFGIAALVLVGVLMLAWQHFELRAHGYDINALRKQLAAEQSEGRRLMLELERLRTPKRIQDIAINKLHMIEPSYDDAIVIQRVQPADPPAPSVVASR